MTHVYLLQSLRYPNQRYVGSTSDVGARVGEHNAGRSPHTAKYAPWELVASVTFPDNRQALAFERYLKSGSGRAFARRHFDRCRQRTRGAIEQ